MSASGATAHDTKPAARASAPAPSATPAGPVDDALQAVHRGLGNDFLRQAISAPDDAAERLADARAAEVLRAAPVPITPAGDRTPFLPVGVAPAIAERAGGGRPLDPGDLAWFEPRFGADLGHVRVHDDPGAAALAEAAGAGAFTVGSHIFLGAGAGRALLAHELAHVEQEHRTPTLWRAPAAQAGAERLVVTAGSTTEAARTLAAAWTRRTGPGSRLFIGLSSRFITFYDSDGTLLDRVGVKESQRLSFVPGVYVLNKNKLVALVYFNANPDGRWALESTGAEGGSHIFTRESKSEPAPAGTDAAAAKKPAAAAPAAPTMETLDIEELVGEPDRVRSLAARIPAAHTSIFFVPEMETHDIKVPRSDKAGAGVYASPIEGRGDGEPANAPPWPVSVEGPKLVPIDSDPTFAAKVDWSANGNYTLASQVISQVGQSIHYRWERYDITAYARRQLAADPAGATAAAKTKAPGAEKTLDQRIEEFTRAKVGSGTDVTGSGGARREFSREYEDWWKDTKRSAAATRDPNGDTVGEKLSSLAANRLSLELAPVSLLVTTLGATLRLIADLFAGPRQQQEIPLEQEGIFLIRVITTPAINEDREGKPIIRPPSVAAKVVEVSPMDRAVREALDEPSAQLAELQAQIDLAAKTGNQAKVDYLKSLLAEAKFRFEGSPLLVLQKRRAEKQKELESFRIEHPGQSDYTRVRDLALIDDQLTLGALHESRRTEGASGLAPAVRVNATLISEVTGEQYPLLISAGPMAMDGDQHRWLISDVTNRDGFEYVGQGATPSAAFRSALTKFGGKAAYGRGRIGVRTAGLGLETGAAAELFVDSAPADWALAEKRIDDLVATLAALGLFVASAGAAGALIGAGVAAARLIERWHAGHLRLDAQTVSDVLGILGGLGAAGQLAAGLRVQKFDKLFAITVEGGATEAQLTRAAAALRGAQTLARVVELANEAINYGGLLWGNLQFLDQMVDIARQESSGAITHAAARRARAGAISSAVQNTGLFVAANAMKAKQSSAATEKPVTAEGSTAAKDTGAPAREAPPLEKAPPVEKAPPTEKAPPVEKAPPTEKAPPVKKAPSDEKAPAEEKRPDATVPKADAVPIGERQATLAELREAMPADLRQMVSIDPALKGDAVHVDYTLDKQSGLITEIKVRCSPDARPGTVALHTDTVRTMQKYQGFAGRVRSALNWVGELVGLDTLNPANKAQFEAKLEVGKLPKLIEAQLELMSRMEPNARDLAEAELAHLEVQLEQHMRTLDLGGFGEGAGYVAAEGLSRPKQRKYAELLTKLREHEAGSDTHRKIRREMYELIGGKLEYPAWKSIYDANVERANKANVIVAAEQQRLGWGKTEQTVPTGRGEVRRLDIADVGRRRGVEIKAYETGKIYASEDIIWEVNRDAKLVKQGWNIKWVLIDTEASAPLLKALSDAGILVENRTAKGGSTEFVSRTLPSRK